MYPNSDPNDQWWQGDFSHAEDVPVSPVPAPAAKKTPYVNGFHVQLPDDLIRGSEVEMARIIFTRANNMWGHIVHADGEFWAFKTSKWEIIPDTVMRQVIHEFDGATYGKNSVVKMKSGMVSGILRELTAKCSAPDFFNEPALGLNCRNGVVKLDPQGVATLHPHSPDDRHRFTIDADYKPVTGKALPQTSLVFKLLEGVFKDDHDKREKINLVAEILGAAAYGLATHLKQPKGFIFYGQSANNGKSTVASLIELLLPKTSVSHIPLSAFNDEKRIVNLAGKAANIVEELSSQSISGETYKAAVTGQPIEGRNLYKSATTFVPRALHVATTNVLPTFVDGIDRGLQRRLFVVTFERVIPDAEIIADITQDIKANEMHILISLAVAGASRLVRNKAYTVPQSTTEAMHEWLMKDAVFAWFSENYKTIGDPAATAWYPSKRLYAEFTGWCENEGIKEKFITSKERFGQKLSSMKGVERRRIDGYPNYRGFVIV